MAILAAGAHVHRRVRADGSATRLVIQCRAMDYDRPIAADFTARSSQLLGERFVSVVEEAA